MLDRRMLDAEGIERGKELVGGDGHERLWAVRCYYHQQPMRLKMKRIIYAAAMVLAITAYGGDPAAAQVGNAPWCAVISTGTGSVYWDCRYRTVDITAHQGALPTWAAAGS